MICSIQSAAVSTTAISLSIRPGMGARTLPHATPCLARMAFMTA